MTLEYTPYVLPFVISTVMLFALAIYSFRLRHKVEIAGLFSLQNIAMGLWTLCYALELSSTTTGGKVLWAKMKYVGATTGPVLWLGRFDADKGPDLAIEACRKAGLPLVLAGKCNQADEWRYLDEVIRPMLGPDVELMLNAGREHTDPLLSHCRALLMSIRWEEPFGMVMIEAMAKGTPVVAMRRGSVPEVVLHGRTGVICLDESELPDALHAADTLDPADCVNHVRTTFSVELMAHRYERVYRKLIDGRERRTAPLNLSSRGLL